MSLPVFTLIHILISGAALLSGLIVVGGWLAGKHFKALTATFLSTTVLTSVTGFFFPFRAFTPAHAVGGLSLVILLAALYAFYLRRMVGPWHKVYLVTAMIALYLNCFVLIAQLFQKTPALIKLAPTQTEPAFGISQALVFLAFAGLGFAVLRRLRLDSQTATTNR